MEATVASKLIGYEFDWFALDEADTIGLFSSAGFGEIPLEVLRHEQAHRVIAERLSALTRDAAEIWVLYGQLGLFVFDWQHWQGPYRKEVSPTLTIEAGLRREILRIPELPRLAVRFEWVQGVAVPRAKA